MVEPTEKVGIIPLEVESWICSHHSDCQITFFCYDENCFEPLCYLCKQEHVEAHKKNDTIPFLLSFMKVVTDAKDKLVQALDGINFLNRMVKDLQSQNPFQKMKYDSINKSTLEHFKTKLPDETLNQLENTLGGLRGPNAPDVLRTLFKGNLMQEVNLLQLKGSTVATPKDHQSKNFSSKISDCSIYLPNLIKSKSEDVKFAQTAPLKRLNTFNAKPTAVKWLVQTPKNMISDDQDGLIPLSCEPLEIATDKAMIPSIEMIANEDLSTGLRSVDEKSEKDSCYIRSKKGLAVYSSESEEELEELENYKAVEKLKPSSESEWNTLDTRTSLEPSQTNFSLASKGIKMFGRKPSFISAVKTYETVEESIFGGEGDSLDNIDQSDQVSNQNTIEEIDDLSFDEKALDRSNYEIIQEII